MKYEFYCEACGGTLVPDTLREDKEGWTWITGFKCESCGLKPLFSMHIRLIEEVD